VLGQSETNVLMSAYGAIANGVWNRPHLISRILDSSDCRDRNDLKTRRIYSSTKVMTQMQVLRPQADVMNAMLGCC